MPSRLVQPHSLKALTLDAPYDVSRLRHSLHVRVGCSARDTSSGIRLIGNPAPRGGSHLSGCILLAACAVVQRTRRGHGHYKHRGYKNHSGFVCLNASGPTQDRAAALMKQSELPSETDLRRLFKIAAGGRDTVTFDEAVRLEGVDGILDEGASTVDELAVIWGDDEEPLDFEGFSDWYCEVVKMYDEYLWEDAVAPSDDLLADVAEEEDEREWTDEELLEDAPTQGISVEELVSQKSESGEEYRTAPVRENIEITQLFRQQCDEDNQLSFNGLCKVSEISSMISDGDVTVEELRDMWSEISNKEGTIDILAFRDLLARVDALFEFVEDGEVEEAGGERQQETGKLGKDPSVVKKELLDLIESLLTAEEGPCGLDGRDVTDVSVVKLAKELESIWRSSSDIAALDPAELSGDWELLYCTSSKWRRWQSVLNAGRDIPDAKFEALVQSFNVVEEPLLRYEYDMEELFLSGNDELAMRGMGTYTVSIQQNVVTGDEDVVVKLELLGVEFDTKEEKTKQAEAKLTRSQMCRTFCYSFLGYLDDDLRIMRADLAGNGFYIYQRIRDDD